MKQKTGKSGKTDNWPIQVLLPSSCYQQPPDFRQLHVGLVTERVEGQEQPEATGQDTGHFDFAQ